MGSVSLELKPDRLLLDSNFDGYKLSLEEIPIALKTLMTPVHKAVLNSSQYSLLHAKLFALQNHLVGDIYDDSAVYFVDTDFSVLKTYVDSLSNDLVDPVKVWNIPKVREHRTGDCNVTLKFANSRIIVLSDGMGTMHILDSRDKNDDDSFYVQFSGKVLTNEEQGFVISDAVFCDDKQELHVLLTHVQEDPNDRFVTIVHWLVFKQSDSTESRGQVWGQTGLRQLKTKGEVQYLYLEKTCDHIYVVSDAECGFVLNSDHPVVNEAATTTGAPQMVYKWSQDLDTITVKLILPEDSEKRLVKVNTKSNSLEVTYNSNTLLSGEFFAKIDPSLTTWTLGSDNVLEISLSKGGESDIWPELVKGDKQGEYVLDTCIVENANSALGNLTSETEATPQTGTTFNSQQVEECDFESDKSETFQRIDGVTNKTTHKVHLGSHQVILAPHLNPELPPALGIRHDVDVCLWQPIHGDNFQVKHEGTLLAFGYVQASKQNRKFIACAPNLDYSVISESSGHVFIYKQNKPLLSSELRHRNSGLRVKKVAQQQVLSLPNQEILGLFAGNKYLYLLGDGFVMALTVGSGD